jgi:tRNA/rRNA methyltransferase
MGRPSKASRPSAAAPVVILVRPQLGENIGMAARAMLNCGLGELRLVAPRDEWPNARAERAASGADEVLKGARVFDDVASAVADLHRVYATSARSRELTQRIAPPREAADDMVRAVAAKQRVGLMFGPERAGLENDDLAHADIVITIPLNPAFSSLNLAQAVLLVAYEWSQAVGETGTTRLVTNEAAIASRAELEEFVQRLEAELDEAGFFKVAEKRPRMMQNIRALFSRAEATDQEIRTLHGILSELVGKRRRKTPR